VVDDGFMECTIGGFCIHDQAFAFACPCTADHGFMRHPQVFNGFVRRCFGIKGRCLRLKKFPELISVPDQIEIRMGHLHSSLRHIGMMHVCGGRFGG
jgi:hypothetical protein